jgi:hypothetical protein
VLSVCRLSDETISALECLKSWSRDGLITDAFPQIVEIDEMLDALNKASIQRRRQELEGMIRGARKLAKK